MAKKFPHKLFQQQHNFFYLITKLNNSKAIKILYKLLQKMFEMAAIHRNIDAFENFLRWPQTT